MKPLSALTRAGSSLRLPAAARPSLLTLTAAALLLSGCTTVFERDSVAEYRKQAARTVPLDVPPDLTQLARDSRFLPQGGVVSASQAQRPGEVTPGNAGPAVAVLSLGQIEVGRIGSQRWLVLPNTPPEQVWPQLRSFWEQNGFTLATDNPVAGVMETNWNENRAKLPNDVVRNALAAAVGRIFDTGERDQYRTRVERTASGGSEVYITHRGVQEVDTNDQSNSTVWRPRPNDPSLEAEFLARLMVRMGTPAEVARSTVAAAPEAAARARVLAGQPAAALELDEPFDRAWRRVGVALDRGGFSTEDRDRAGGLYYVRYIDPRLAGKEEPGFFSRLFSGEKGGTTGPVRYRVALKSQGDKTVISVLSSAGEPETGEDAQRIVTQLVSELR